MATLANLPVQSAQSAKADANIGTIRSVSAECYCVPLAQPLTDAAHGVHRFFELVVCRVETSGGLSGVGYTYTGGSGGRAIAEFIRSDLANVAEGMQASEVSAVWSAVQRKLHYVGRGGLLSFALSALDIALWDILCRAADQSLAEFIGEGAPLPHVDTYSGFIDLQLDGAALASLAEDALDRGFVAIKTKVGRESQAEDIARVELLRSVLGANHGLMVDANFSLDVERAISFSKSIEHLNIGWFEEPISPDDFEGYATIAEATSIPLAMGENLHVLDEFSRAIRYSKLGILQPDASNIGGITGWLTVAKMADAAGIQVCTHGMHELHVSLLASRKAPGCLEWHSFPIDEYTTHPLRLKDGKAVTPDLVGLGVEFDFARLRKHRIS